MPRFRTTDGVDLAYTDEGAGTPVVLVAGFTAPATTWHVTQRALLGAGYRVVAFDRRNHGESASPAHGQRLSRHGKDLAELLDHLDLSAAVLVGGSMGASSIWAYLDLFGFDRCLGMVSVDQTPRMLNGDGWEHGFYGLTRKNLGTLFAAGIPATGRGLDPSTTTAGLMRLVEETGAMPAMRDAADPVTLPLLADHAAADGATSSPGRRHRCCSWRARAASTGRPSTRPPSRTTTPWSRRSSSRASGTR
ncbi:alpha/beta fold hydrolase [Agilicoccus flavus]|uniref:alpha/beta fold hydrolase n=1 Tax=Agilicoccus flavus TaxID=2775968 RepID=UPI001CF69CCF|nr:alpha/beta hydrolase [Agilicoccus flavus]